MKYGHEGVYTAWGTLKNGKGTLEAESHDRAWARDWLATHKDFFSTCFFAENGKVTWFGYTKNGKLTWEFWDE